MQLHAFNPVLAGRLQKTLDSMLVAKNVKGISAGVYYPGMGTWKGVSGISHASVPINSDMQFAIASNTKLFTAVLLLKLAENNLLSIDDSLHEFLPTYRNIDSTITIRQLLNHTSGLADVTSVSGYPDSIMNNPRRIYSPAELMTWAGEPTFAPGKGWEYCNTNYLLAGMIAEKVTGQSYGKLLRDSILNPLNLDSTFLDVFETVPPVIAHPWQAGKDNNAIPRIALNSAAWSAGAMYSNSSEMIQWYDALMNGKVINAQSLKEMTTFVGTGRYGMGIAETVVNNIRVWTHGGQIWGGYNSSMMYDPQTGIIVCVLTNQLPAQAFQISAEMMSIVKITAVDIDETQVQNTIIYPNPTNSIVQVTIPNQEILSVRLLNSNGAFLQEYAGSSFSVSHLPHGAYFLHVQTNQKLHVMKLIKQ
jgi:D-alanyl-D-alanine carboxypeptidase